MENILITIIAGIFVALLLAFMVGLSWAIMSLIVDVIKELRKNNTSYVKLETKKKENSFKSGLLLGLVLGWFFFGE